MKIQSDVLQVKQFYQFELSGTPSYIFHVPNAFSDINNCKAGFQSEYGLDSIFERDKWYISSIRCV